MFKAYWRWGLTYRYNNSTYKICREDADYAMRILERAHYLDVKNIGSLGNIGMYLEFNNIVDVLVSTGFFYRCAFPAGNSLNMVEIDHDLARLLTSYLPFNMEALKKRRVLVLADPECMREKILSSFFKRVETLMYNKYDKEEIVICKCGFGEDFYEFLASFFLRNQGYIVFPGGTLDHLVYFYGFPDIVAAKLGEFQRKLVEKGIINGGTIITELHFKKFNTKNIIKPGHNIIRSINETYFVAIEVEPSPDRASGGRGQASKYAMSEYFRYGMLACPGREGDEKYYPDIGLITWRANGDIFYYEPRNIDESNKLKVDMVTEVTKKLLVYMILRNIPLDRLANRYPNKSFNDIITIVDVETILDDL